MDWTTVTQLIGSIGFPIVMCVMLYNMIKDQMARFNEAISNNTIMIARFNEAINANTLALAELKNVIAYAEGDNQ